MSEEAAEYRTEGDKAKKPVLDKANGSGKLPASKKKAGPRSKKERRETPYPKYHINHQEWDKLAVMTAICDELVSSSKGLAYVCADNDEIPTVKTVFMWMAEEDKLGGEKPLCDMYARAKDIQVDYMADEIIDISDNQTAQPVLIDGVPLMVDGKIVKIVDSASVQHAKLRSDNRKWIASKLKPRKYGEKLELASDPERPLSGMTIEELILKQKALEAKLNGA